jgi:hypothetical protein
VIVSETSNSNRKTDAAEALLLRVEIPCGNVGAGNQLVRFVGDLTLDC